jgi:hypothetical protein
MNICLRMVVAVLALSCFVGCEVNFPDSPTYVNTGDQGHNSDNTDNTTADNGGEVERQ